LTTYIIRRILLTLIVVILVSFLSFSLIQIMPGDPAAAMLDISATREEIEALRHELWLDRPFLIQYGHWMNNVLHGDLGISTMYRQPINSLVASRLPITLYLSFLPLF
jgi:peptide/nickel transport system permease protein